MDKNSNLILIYLKNIIRIIDFSFNFLLGNKQFALILKDRVNIFSNKNLTKNYIEFIFIKSEYLSFFCDIFYKYFF